MLVNKQNGENFNSLQEIEEFFASIAGFRGLVNSRSVLMNHVCSSSTTGLNVFQCEVYPVQSIEQLTACKSYKVFVTFLSKIVLRKTHSLTQIQFSICNET